MSGAPLVRLGIRVRRERAEVALAALLPLLPAKQRPTDPNDWMSTDAEVACPDPNCPSRFRITRLGKRVFRHAEVTAVPLPPGTP
jgi:uncharacterized repeat protein (TIGR04076 family)